MWWKATIMQRNLLRLAPIGVAAVIVASCSQATTSGIPPSENGAITSRPSAALIQARSPELVYVTDTNTVSAYPAKSSGPVAPVIVLSDPKLPNTVWDPWGAVFDKSGYLYVQSFLSNATGFVYAPGARTGAKPVRVFTGDGPDVRGIGVDPAGYEYTATSDTGTELDVLPPKANGRPGNYYFVHPLRAIVTDGEWTPWPEVLTTDGKDEAIAGMVRYNGNAIEVFEGGAQGSSSPIREIAGSKTGLGQNPQNLSVTFSALTGFIYVGVSAGQNAHVSIFSDSANGDVAPIRTIRGSKTGLSGRDISGLAVSDRDGDLYVMSRTGSSVSGQIYVYASDAKGNVPPLRSFVDKATGFTSAQGIGISH